MPWRLGSGEGSGRCPGHRALLFALSSSNSVSCHKCGGQLLPPPHVESSSSSSAAAAAALTCVTSSCQWQSVSMYCCLWDHQRNIRLQRHQLQLDTYQCEPRSPTYTPSAAAAAYTAFISQLTETTIAESFCETPTWPLDSHYQLQAKIWLRLSDECLCT